MFLPLSAERAGVRVHTGHSFPLPLRRIHLLLFHPISNALSVDSRIGMCFITDVGRHYQNLRQNRVERFLHSITAVWLSVGL